MANLPLAQDTVHNGVIYLKGETGYPDELIRAIEDKGASIKRNMDSPIFMGSRPEVPTPPPAGPTELQVPTAVPPPPQPVPDTPLPEDFPYREEFVTAGYETVEAVDNIPDLKEVAGIGPSREAEVQVFLESLQADEVDHEEATG